MLNCLRMMDAGEMELRSGLHISINETPSDLSIWVVVTFFG